ncbi:MAG: hypothetical protein WC421_11365 [Elusimicrobiales bacterium]
MGFLRRIFAVFAALALCAGACHASGAGTTSANFLKIPAAPVPAALQAYTALSGPDSVLYNPAGLGFMNFAALSAAHNQYISGLRQEYAAFAMNTNIGTFAVAASFLGSGSFDAYDAGGNPAGQTSSSHMMGIISYAQSFPHWNRDRGSQDPQLPLAGWARLEDLGKYRRIYKRVSVGASLRYFHERLDDVSSSGVTADAGVAVSPSRKLVLAASVLNITGKQDFGGGGFDLPRTIRAGAATDFVAVKRLMVFAPSADYVKEQDAAGYFCAGLGVSALELFSIRAGMRFDRDIGNGLSLGLGLDLDSLSAEKSSLFSDMRIDYSWSDEGDMGFSQRLGLQLLFL